MPGRDHDTLGLERTVAGCDDPACVATVESLDLYAGPHVEGLAFRIVLQVVDDTVPRGPLAERTRHSVTGQAREPADRVQV